MHVNTKSAIAAAWCACTIAHAAPAPSVVPDSAFLSPQRLIPVDGTRRINLFCVGAGIPTVILDDGAGGGMMFWRHVQLQIGAFTQACAYDRAGYGFSDVSARASDAANTVDDLHRLLHAADIPTPIVYVGHSIAGLYGVLFAATHAAELAGAVLVDPSFAHQDTLAMATQTSAQRQAANDNVAKTIASMKTCLALSRSGGLTPPKTKDAVECLDDSSMPEKLSAALLQEVRRQWSEPASNATALSEFSSFLSMPGHPDLDSAELDAHPASLGNKPLIILTHGKQPPPGPDFNPAQQKADDAAWNAGHDALAKLSSGGSNRFVPDASHYIQIDKPAVVVDAVHEVVTKVRVIQR